jgi:hypothetical protein
MVEPQDVMPLFWYALIAGCIAAVLVYRLLACRHSLVEIARYHRDARTRAEFGKEAFVDVHGVYNFVRCCHCKTVLAAGPLKDRIYASAAEEPEKETK